MTFNQTRRQKFMSQAIYDDVELGFKEIIERFTPHITDEQLHYDSRTGFAWDVANNSLELLILHYTGGRPLTELQAELPEVIAAFDRYLTLKTPPYLQTPPLNEADTLDIEQHEAYVYVLWLLALCKLLGYPELIPTVIKWVDRNIEDNRGHDGLFESIIEKLTGSCYQSERFLFHPDAYRPLAKVTVSDPAERPALMKTFVENWYKHMKPCYWYGEHTYKAGESSFFGYWCFEAALVTFLWDIDDTSYRDHLVYPKDLVDFAREHFSNAAEQYTPLSCKANTPCPQTGYWFTPAQQHSRQHFNQGDLMPEIGNKDWDTIWQWDGNQEDAS